MSEPVEMVEIWRGDFLECVHRGHAVVCDAGGAIVEAWGDPQKVILPRSSCKMVQALPLIESGAAQGLGLTTEYLALACASHNGAPMHTERVARWLDMLGKGEPHLKCGAQLPEAQSDRADLVRAGQEPTQIHNNCSGKHTGFLTLAAHLKAGPDYVAGDHPVQRAVRAAFEEVTEESSPGFAIDGCSAPNFATSLHGLARAASRFAAPGSDSRGAAMVQLTQAMMAHPELVAGERRACTELMRAMPGKAALKTGAEGVFLAILPEMGLGVALKIEDGASRASNCAIASILVRLGVLDPDHPAALRFRNAPIRNRRGLQTGFVHPAAPLL